MSFSSRAPMCAALLLALQIHAPANALAALAANDPTEPAKPTRSWAGGSVIDSNGVFVYCVMESQYNNGETLVLGRRADGSSNLGIGRPTGKLPVGKTWTVRLLIDDAFRREREAKSPEKDFLIVANGRDEECFRLLAKGHVLTIEREIKTARAKPAASNFRNRKSHSKT
ncbi:exported hypothetical protein [Azospirillaceae bacterium]